MENYKGIKVQSLMIILCIGLGYYSPFIKIFEELSHIK